MRLLCIMFCLNIVVPVLGQSNGTLRQYLTNKIFADFATTRSLIEEAKGFDINFYLKDTGRLHLIEESNLMIHELSHFVNILYDHPSVRTRYKKQIFYFEEAIALKSTKRTRADTLFKHYYLSADKIFKVPISEVVKSSVVYQQLPDSNLSQLYFTDYIKDSDDKDKISIEKGIYGLLEEWNAFYHAARAQNELCNQILEGKLFNEVPLSDNGSIFDVMAHNVLAYFTFKLYLCHYLKYAKANYPQLYREWKQDINLVNLMRELNRLFMKEVGSYYSYVDEYNLEVLAAIEEEGEPRKGLRLLPMNKVIISIDGETYYLELKEKETTFVRRLLDDMDEFIDYFFFIDYKNF